jgi:hypothetical protein
LTPSHGSSFRIRSARLNSYLKPHPNATKPGGVAVSGHQGAAGKVSTGEKETIAQEKADKLARLLEERMFRCEPGFKLELVRKIIGGVERTILVGKLKLSAPPRTVQR